LNGIGSHVHEYDDTLPKSTSIERTGRLRAIRVCEREQWRGETVHAFILG
jgi:hypothetical protein